MEHWAQVNTWFLNFIFRCYTTQELIDLVESEEFWKVDVFMVPPDDGDESAGDSGDDDEPNNINHLSGRQLQAQATAKVNHEGRTILLGGDEDDDYDSEDDIPLANLVTKVPIARIWSEKVDLQPKLLPFIAPKEHNDQQLTAIACFELFFDEQVLEFLKEMFEIYARDVKSELDILEQ